MSRQTKLAHIFYTSTSSLISFFMPYIKLCSGLQVKFDWKRCDKVIKDGCFPQCSLPLLSFIWHLCNIYQPSVPSFYAWRLVRLSSFQIYDFFQTVQSTCVCILLSFNFISALYSRKGRCLLSGLNYTMAVKIVLICSNAFVPLWKEN